MINDYLNENIKNKSKTKSLKTFAVNSVHVPI